VIPPPEHPANYVAHLCTLRAIVGRKQAGALCALQPGYDLCRALRRVQQLGDVGVCRLLEPLGHVRKDRFVRVGDLILEFAISAEMPIRR
jgi:hypothetical protein